MKRKVEYNNQSDALIPIDTKKIFVMVILEAGMLA